MSSSAEPASGSSVAWRKLTAILDDERFYCCAVVELDGNQLCSMKGGNCDVLHVAFREGRGSRTRHPTVSCCAPATERSAVSFPGKTRSKRWKKKESKADRRHTIGSCFEHIEFMFRNITFIPFEKLLRGYDFFRMGKVLFRKLGIPSDFNICVSWFLCLRAGYRGGNDLVAQCLRLRTYCLEHVVKEQSKENMRVQNIMWYCNTQEMVTKESILC